MAGDISALDFLLANADLLADDFEAIYSNKIINLVREEQLYKRGITGENKPLKKYKKFTIDQKKKKGQIYEHRTLRDTGDFYDAMFFDSESENDRFSVSSEDDKLDLILKENPQEGLLYVTEKNNAKVVAWLSDMIIDSYKQYLEEQFFDDDM